MTKSRRKQKSHPAEKSEQPENRANGLRLWLFRLIAIIVIPLLFFFLTEAGLRLFNFGYPSTALIESEADHVVYLHENPAFAYRFFPQKLAREFVPLRFNGEKVNGVFRIIILGGSAAQGTPDPAYAFGRILEVMLQHSYPDMQFEVLNLAMAAINSHVVVEIAKECVMYDPDLFIVYLGNNEVIGPYGPGTVLTPIFSSNTLLQLAIQFKATRISQLITRGLEELNLLAAPQQEWSGMEMFIKNQVPLNDPRLETTYSNFSNNLEKLSQISHDNDISIIYSTVVSNLKDCPPFSSLHRNAIKQEELQAWDNLYRLGSASEQNRNYPAAISHYLAAAEIDSYYADLHFRLGRCYWQTAYYDKAALHYGKARELDTSRFRADKRINRIIRQAAGSISGVTFLADALKEIEIQSPRGVPGRQFLLEHVHLNFDGNYQVAKAIFKQISNLLTDVLKNDAMQPNETVDDSLCAARLVYNNSEHQRIIDLVLNKFILRPPFTNQLYHEETVHSLQQTLDSLQLVIRNEDTVQIISSYEQAIRKRPSDWWLHSRYGEYLDKIGRYQQAADHFRFVINSIPHNANAYVLRGSVLAKLGRLQEALHHNQRALALNPAEAGAYFNCGLIYQKMNKTDLAVENYQKAVYYEPAHSKAYNNLAFIFTQRGDASGALEFIEEGLQNSPDDIHLNYNRAMLLFQQGKKREAIRQLQQVVKLAPQQKSLQEKLETWTGEE